MNHASWSKPHTYAGSIRVVSKRKERAAILPKMGETIIDVDRTHPVLGNPHHLKDHTNAVERTKVLARYLDDLEADIAIGGPKSQAIDELTARVRSGERLALRCWCAPRHCHADFICTEVIRRVSR